MRPFTQEELRLLLAIGWIEVFFTKKDSTERRMLCTTNSKFIPKDIYTAKFPSREKSQNPDQIRVYEKDVGWRSFMWSSVNSFEFANNE